MAKRTTNEIQDSDRMLMDDLNIAPVSLVVATAFVLVFLIKTILLRKMLRRMCLLVTRRLLLSIEPFRDWLKCNAMNIGNNGVKCSISTLGDDT